MAASRTMPSRSRPSCVSRSGSLDTSTRVAGSDRRRRGPDVAHEAVDLPPHPVHARQPRIVVTLECLLHQEQRRDWSNVAR
jgi:hypothetical protein